MTAGANDREHKMLRAMLHRRDLLRCAAGGLVLPFAQIGAAAAAAAVEPIPRRILFEDPDYQNVQISPDGQNLAYLAPLDGVRNLWVAPLAEPGSGRPVTRATDRDIRRSYRWAYNNRHLIFFRDHDGDENWRASGVDITTGSTLLLTPEKGVRSDVQELDPRFPDEALLRHNERDRRYFDLYRTNLISGASERIIENRDYVDLVTDSHFRLRLAVRYAADGSAEVFELTAEGVWTPFTTVGIADIEGLQLLDFSDDGNTLYLLDPRGRDRAVFLALDMTTRRARVLAEDPEADIVRVVFADRIPLAARAMKDRARWHAIDSATAKDLALLGAYGPGDIDFTNQSTGNRKAIAYFERDTASGEYFLLDREARSVRSLYAQHAALATVPLRPLEPVVITARDGLALNGYLTRPALTGFTAPPLVLAIHGGPYARDKWGFDATHQWLANRGYAVLSVNYRGSTGFGKAFVTAAHHEWGGRMHDDLIDALDWAVAAGIGDPNRVGFYGASYGGYSALMAATKTPERFACIVDLFGISNLITFMKTIPPYWGPWFSVWKSRLGDPDTEAGRAFLNERSPLNHIERATKPILIAQGLQDVRVVPAESEQMVQALKGRGVPVTYITFPDEGHGFARPENRLAFFAVAEAFFAKHLGGRYQPIGADFAGSTIRIETGRDLVPGLAG
jgi:dipeptidyl aminopeptidase/acylaminoacyl peptidase